MAAPVSADDFIRKWRSVELKERSAAQEHFIDLCRVLGEPTPADVDPAGEFYCFERGATKTTGGEGWADVCKRGHFGWEYAAISVGNIKASARTSTLPLSAPAVCPGARESAAAHRL